MIERIKINGEWRDITAEDFRAFVENGMGRVEQARVFTSPDVSRNPPVSRGKGKKWKQWERRP
jgi:hypothetical protein